MVLRSVRLSVRLSVPCLRYLNKVTLKRPIASATQSRHRAIVHNFARLIQVCIFFTNLKHADASNLHIEIFGTYWTLGDLVFAVLGQPVQCCATISACLRFVKKMQTCINLAKL